MKMKMLTLIALLAVTPLLAKAEAENQTTGRMSSSSDRLVRRLIPHAGMIFQNYTGADNRNYVAKNGYDIGLLMDLGTSNVVFETGLDYRTYGASTTNLGGAIDITTRYLSIPATAKFYFSGQEHSSLYVKGGPMASTLASRDVSYSPGYAGSRASANSRAWELSAIAGLGYKAYLTPASDLVLEAMYIRALNSLFDNADVYNSSYQATAGFAFNL